MTDENGTYVAPYKHTGKAALYKVVVTLPNGKVVGRLVELRANSYREVHFEIQ